MTLTAIDYDFFEWGIYDEKGTIIGIRGDAPQEAKDAFKKFRQDYEDAAGIK